MGGSPVNTGSMLDSCRCDGLSIYPASLGVREENSHCSSARMAPGGRHPAVAERVVKGAGGASRCYFCEICPKRDPAWF